MNSNTYEYGIWDLLQNNPVWLVGVQIKQDWPGVDHYLKPDDEKNYTILSTFQCLKFSTIKKKRKKRPGIRLQRYCSYYQKDSSQKTLL